MKIVSNTTLIELLAPNAAKDIVLMKMVDASMLMLIVGISMLMAFAQTAIDFIS
jgi:hypothetical protein